MLGLDTSWYIGSLASARPPANEPFTPPKRRHRLVRKSSMTAFLEARPRLGFDIGCPNAAQTHREQPQPRPHVRVVLGAAQTHEKPAAARARSPNRHLA